MQPRLLSLEEGCEGPSEPGREQQQLGLCLQLFPMDERRGKHKSQTVKQNIGSGSAFWKVFGISHKGGFSKTGAKCRIKCEQGSIPTVTHRQLPNNYQVLRALVPRALG